MEEQPTHVTKSDRNVQISTHMRKGCYLLCSVNRQAHAITSHIAAADIIWHNLTLITSTRQQHINTKGSNTFT